jgi:hypothetical protein
LAFLKIREKKSQTTDSESIRKHQDNKFSSRELNAKTAGYRRRAIRWR